jgi:hypothetical protein
MAGMSHLLKKMDFGLLSLQLHGESGVRDAQMEGVEAWVAEIKAEIASYSLDNVHKCLKLHTCTFSLRINRFLNVKLRDLKRTKLN